MKRIPAWSAIGVIAASACVCVACADIWGFDDLTVGDAGEIDGRTGGGGAALSDSSRDSDGGLGNDTSVGADAGLGRGDASGDGSPRPMSDGGCRAGVTACSGECCETAVVNAQPTCTAGTCSFACNAGYNFCAGACIQYTTRGNCGSCGSACTGATPLCSGPGGTASCVSGCPSTTPECRPSKRDPAMTPGTHIAR